MPLLERYVLRRLFAVAAISFGLLFAMFWATESLERVDIVTARGQNIWVFQIITMLVLAQVAQALAPIAFLIGLVFTLSQMNSDSELAVITASGARRRAIVRPVLVAAALLSAGVAAFTTTITPLSISGMRDLVYRVRADIINVAVREGGFHSLDGTKLIIHISERAADGSFRGVFINDVRDAAESVQYIADRAALFKEVGRAFLILTDGTVIRDRPAENSTEIVDFKTHAVDLSQFVNATWRRITRVNELSTAELINPNRDDPDYRDRPEKYAAELHTRIASPLYPFAFAGIGLAALSRPRSGRHDSIAAAVAVMLLAAVVLVLTGISIHAVESGKIGWPVLYAIPGTAILAGFGAFFAGLRLSTPDWAGAALSAVLTPLSRLFQAAVAGEAARRGGSR